MGNYIQKPPSPQNLSALYPQLPNSSSLTEPFSEIGRTKAIKISWQKTIPQTAIEEITSFEQRKKAASFLSNGEGVQEPLSRQANAIQKFTCAQKRVFPSFSENNSSSSTLRPSPILRPATYEANSKVDFSDSTDPWSANFIEGYDTSLPFDLEGDVFKSSSLVCEEELKSAPHNHLVLQTSIETVDPWRVVVPMTDEAIEKSLPESILKSIEEE